MFLAMLPFIGVFFRRIHAWWHAKFSHKDHQTKVNPSPVLFDELQKATPNIQGAVYKMVDKTPYQKGLEAFDNGLIVESNPYEPGSDEYYSWLCGWQNAHTDAQNPDYKCY